MALLAFLQCVWFKNSAGVYCKFNKLFPKITNKCAPVSHLCNFASIYFVSMSSL